MAVAQSRSTALIKESQAESSNSNKMDGMRRHDEKMLAANVLKTSAEDSKIVVSGKNGEKLINYYVNTLDEIDKR